MDSFSKHTHHDNTKKQWSWGTYKDPDLLLRLSLPSSTDFSRLRGIWLELSIRVCLSSSCSCVLHRCEHAYGFHLAYILRKQMGTVPVGFPELHTHTYTLWPTHTVTRHLTRRRGRLGCPSSNRTPPTSSCQMGRKGIKEWIQTWWPDLKCPSWAALIKLSPTHRLSWTCRPQSWRRRPARSGKGCCFCVRLLAVTEWVFVDIASHGLTWKHWKGLAFTHIKCWMISNSLCC